MPAAARPYLDRVDLLDRTAVLDVKPFEPHLDVPGHRAAGLDPPAGLTPEADET